MSSRVFPTGVVRYIPEKCWNGFTLIPSVDSLSTARGAALFDMNGNLVHTWEGVYGAFDNKLLPNGDILGTSGYMKGYWLDCVDIVQKDWNGNLLLYTRLNTKSTVQITFYSCNNIGTA